MDDRRARIARKRLRIREHAVTDCRRGRVGRVVEEHGGDALARNEIEARRIPALGVEGQQPEVGSRQGDSRRIVGVVRVWQQDRVAALGKTQDELDERRLRAWDDRHLTRGIELDAVVLA